ncbi:hypothetical protein M8C13_28905 [Crossiella sp. SN42]|uniref:hypothetical protein n=1 Tax=Crossiella sp. SN42 TaxID=2944808 RepID=UPI00207C8610|nr:hypothetical protein [Crossiella sp. SN42]MCO1579778.1 hypothetical protein [Crossiella sp. SN42]
MSPEELEAKLFASRDLPYGPARTAAVEDVIRHADALGLADLQYTARIFSLEAYRYGAEPAKTFVPFAWCLAAYDRGEGDRRLDHHLFWNFKGIVSSLADFPEVPLDQTRAVLDDMERRYRQAGHGMNPVHQYREFLARHVGDRDTAAEQFRRWQASPRGELSDCAGCEPNAKINHLVWLGQDEEAVAVALPVLSGQLSCREQPHGIRTDLLLPYLRTGRLTEAAEAHRSAYRAVRHDRAELVLIAEHLIFCARTGNHPRGLELLERHLGWLDEPSTPAAAMHFAAAAALVLTRVIEAGHPDTPVRRPAYRDRAAVDWPATALRDELAEQALELAARFDARNGTAEQGEQIRAVLAAEPLVEHLPLSGPARAAARLAVAEPPQISFPATPEELADAAEEAAEVRDHDRLAALWARFDEVCPQPPPVLRARRLGATASDRFEDDPAAAEGMLREAAAIFAEHGEPALAATARSRAALACCYDHRAEQGLPELHAVAEELAALGADRALVRARGRIVDALRETGETEAAIRLGRELAEATDGHPDRLLAADCWMTLLQVWIDREEPDHAAAVGAVLRTVEILAELPPSPLLHRTRLAAGHTCAVLDDVDTAYPLYAAAADAEDPLLRVLAQHHAGRSAHHLDRAEEAFGHLTAALTDALRFEVELDLLEIKLDLAAAALATGRPDQAADLAEEVLTEAAEHDQLGRARFLLSHAHRALGQPDAALTVLDELAAQCAEQDNRYGLAQMHGIAAEILDELDRDAEAARRHQAAAEALAGLGEPLRELEHRRLAALSWHWARENNHARTALAEADTLAATLGEEPPEVFQRALLDHDAARILTLAEDKNPALARASAAAEGFHRLSGAEGPALTADVFRGRLLMELGRGAEAEPLLTAALDRLEPEAPQREHVEELLAQLREGGR